MKVWLLVMVLLAPPGGFAPAYLLQKFDTLEECQKERNRIGFDMAASYPHDADFRIECREKIVPGIRTSDAPTEQLNYTEIIKAWMEVRHPQETLRIKVRTVKPVLTTRGPNGIMAFQTFVYYPTGSQAYILFIRNANVIGWIDAGIPPEETEEEEEMEEVFSYKDQA